MLIDSIIVLCLIHGLMYDQREYLSNIKSPEIMSIFTKFRLDTNCTFGSLRRSFRNNNITNSSCICGEGEQEVEHTIMCLSGNYIDTQTF